MLCVEKSLYVKEICQATIETMVLMVFILVEKTAMYLSMMRTTIASMMDLSKEGPKMEMSFEAGVKRGQG